MSLCFAPSRFGVTIRRYFHKEELEPWDLSECAKAELVEGLCLTCTVQPLQLYGSTHSLDPLCYQFFSLQKELCEQILEHKLVPFSISPEQVLFSAISSGVR